MDTLPPTQPMLHPKLLLIRQPLLIHKVFI